MILYQLWPHVSGDAGVQARYEAMRRDGESHRVAELLAYGQPPACMTDAVFLQGHCNGNQFATQPRVGDFYRREAQASGVDVKGKVYLSGLADYPGDPRAWVSGRGDAERLCRERGWSCRGAVNVQGEAPAGGTEPYRVADDIVQAEVQERLEALPQGERADAEGVREQVRALRSPDSKL